MRLLCVRQASGPWAKVSFHPNDSANSVICAKLLSSVIVSFISASPLFLFL